jgi:arabinosyltransferase A
LVGARGVVGIIRARRIALPAVAGLAGSAALVFVIVFRDQTLATVAESARIKYTVGPTISWYQNSCATTSSPWKIPWTVRSRGGSRC